MTASGPSATSRDGPRTAAFGPEAEAPVISPGYEFKSQNPRDPQPRKIKRAQEVIRKLQIRDCLRQIPVTMIKRVQEVIRKLKIL